jgi:hypothetical protein
MTVNEIKSAVESGKRVHWTNGLYEVVKDQIGQWFIVCHANGHAIGLTHQDGRTLNGCGGDFYIPG